jgi:hypothetical protein
VLVAQVRAAVAAARVAQQQWAKTSFATRRRVVGMILKFVLANQEDICKVSMLDSGKTRTRPLLPAVACCCCCLLLHAACCCCLLLPAAACCCLLLPAACCLLPAACCLLLLAACCLLPAATGSDATFLLWMVVVGACAVCPLPHLAATPVRCYYTLPLTHTAQTWRPCLARS